MPIWDAREREYTSVGESGPRAPNCGRARRRTRRTEQNALRAIERSCSVPRRLLLAETWPDLPAPFKREAPRTAFGVARVWHDGPATDAAAVPIATARTI